MLASTDMMEMWEYKERKKERIAISLRPFFT